jgi:hypothetical protein
LLNDIVLNLSQMKLSDSVLTDYFNYSNSYKIKNLQNNLIELDLSSDSLRNIDFRNQTFFPKLAVLNLSFNQIDFFGEFFVSFLQNMRKDFKLLKKFDFYQNSSSIKCSKTCSMVYVKDWLIENKNMINSIDLYGCMSDDGIIRIIDVNENKEENSKCRPKKINHILIGILITFFVVAILIVSIIVRGKRQAKRLKKQRQILLNRNFESDLNDFINQTKDGNNRGFCEDKSRFRSTNKISLRLLRLRLQITKFFTIKKSNERIKYDDDDDKSVDELELFSR